MNQINNRFASIEQITDQYLAGKSRDAGLPKSGISFEEILRQKQEISESSELRFSKHAAMRLNDRNINLSQEQSERLENGVSRASEKGIQESLVILDSLAFIVNVPSRTVVTAMEQGESGNNIFTNIDGAVIV